MADLQSLDTFERALAHIRGKLRPLSQIGREETVGALAEGESAKLNAALAYGVVSLYYMLLKTKGVPTTDHPVQNDLTRIKEYMGRLQKVANSAKEKRPQVDVAATKRFIVHGLQGNETYDAERKAREDGAAASAVTDPPEDLQTPMKPNEKDCTDTSNSGSESDSDSDDANMQDADSSRVSAAAAQYTAQLQQKRRESFGGFSGSKSPRKGKKSGAIRVVRSAGKPSSRK